MRRVPSWGWDLALAASVAVAGTLPSNHPTQWAYPAAVAAGVALVVRRRWPWLALLAAFPALVGGLGTIAAGAAMYSLGRARPTPRVVMPWLAVTVAVALAPVVHQALRHSPYAPAAWGDWVLTVAFVLGVTAAPAAVGALITTRSDLAASIVRLRAAEADRDAAVTARARAEERNRIAREVHDIVGHYAALIAVQASALEANAPDPETKATAIRLRELSSDALEEMRSTVALWRRTEDGPDLLRDWVPWVLQPAVVARASGVELHLAHGTAADETEAHGTPVHDTGVRRSVDEAVLRALRRAVQEGVANAVRHSPGTAVRVQLGEADGQLQLRITNPVSPVPAVDGLRAEAGSGLAGLRDRVRRLGGTVSAELTDGEWQLTVRLPLGSR